MRPEFLCCRHRKEPTCVVGEHKQLLRRLLEFFRVTGEEGTDDARDDAAFMSLKLGFAIVIVGFTDFLPALDSSAILGSIGETFDHEKLVRK